jgi:hypothetical protein
MRPFIPALIALAAAGAFAQQTKEARFLSTLDRIHVAGFQGWFSCATSPAERSWSHWYRDDSDPEDADSLAVDVWPDMSELDPEEKCPTSFVLRSGAPAYLFSDLNPRTVARQFRWMRQYEIDGAVLQRFAALLDGEILQRRADRTLANVRAAAEANGRGFFIMYDGIVAERLDAIKRDWRRLTEEKRLADSPAYMFHRGKPLVGLWGLGFRERDLSAAQAADLIRFFRTSKVPATVLGGVPSHWRILDSDSRDAAEWASVYRALDVISPWTVGRFVNDGEADDFARAFLRPDIIEAKRHGMDYMAVVWPGFSWRNGAGRASGAPLDQIPRRCGKFYEHQIDLILEANVNMLFTAMFDEVNEGTAIFKSAAHSSELPKGIEMIPLDEGGCPGAASDMYLRAAGRATRALRRARAPETPH